MAVAAPPGWSPVALQSGLAQLFAEEVRLTLVSDATISGIDKGGRMGMDSGVLSVTTHRLLWVSSDARRGLGVMLAGITDVQDKSGISPRGKLVVRQRGEAAQFRIELRNRKDAGAIRTAALGAVRAKEWERIALAEARRVEKERKEREFSTSGVGIAGIMAKEKAKERDRGETMSAAFTDLDSLMNHARELVSIAHKFKGVSPGPGVSGPAASSEAQRQQAEIVDLLGSLGIASPITKNATGKNARLYQEQIARQLAEFLGPPLDYLGGVATLIDVYCMYNRARNSTELVSADDLLAACKLFQRLDLPYTLQKLPSGALAIMKGDFGGRASSERLLAMATEQSSLAPLDLVTRYAIPLQIALAQLADAEQRGALCRDEHGIGEDAGGLRFFPNRFLAGFDN